MGCARRALRLRIYFLVAIPLVTMLGLFGDVAYTSVSSFVNLNRAPALINATAVPLANFMSLLQAGRRAAVFSSAASTTDNRGEYESAITATRQGVPALVTALNAPAAKSAANEA